MPALRAKFIVAGSVLTVAVAYLAYAGIKAGRSYYLEVDKYLADASYRTRRVRLHGTVAKEGLSVPAEGGRAEFVLLGRTGRLPVVYEGTVPDLFQAGRDVVVEGRLDEKGVFRSRRLLTKCASKYVRRKQEQAGGGT